MNHDGANSLPERLPPQNLDAERQLLGAWMLDSSTVDECIECVRPDDFYRDCHRVIAAAILDIRGDGRKPDAVEVAEELQRRGEFRAAGGDDYLIEIGMATAHAANARQHAQIVRQRSIARETIQACTEVIREGYSGMHTSAGLLDMAERRIFAIAEREATGSNVEADALMDRMAAVIGRRAEGELQGMATGFAELDGLLCGLKRQELVILGARPSQGKTALATAVMVQACLSHGASVLFASLEMNAESIGDRLLSSWSGVCSEKLRRAWHLTAKDTADIGLAAAGLSAARLTIDDRPSQTVGHVAANARRIKARRGLDLVVVDYLGLMDGQRQKGENRQEEVARLSRRIKAMARELDVPVLCLHQLNRQSETREDRRPRLADLRESGQIEQDADAVLLLHRPEYYDPNDQPGIAEVIVAKNRNGPTGTVRLMFRKACTRFEALSTAASF